MGCASSTPAVPPSGMSRQASVLKFIPDQFSNLEQLQDALRQGGLESSQLILGVDFTKSNEWTGKRSFGGRSLHDTSFSTNPYREAIKVIGKTLEVFDDDRLIPAYGFGTAETGADKLVSFNPEERPCHAFQEVEQRYLQLAQCLHFAGPTTFAPIIRKACEVTSQSGGQYHVLIIVADGQVTRPTSTPEGQLSSFEQDTVNAIVEAANFPLSIIMVGVGDGPWDTMTAFDDAIPHRKWDNWQTVIMDASLAKRGGSLEYCPPAAEAQFALDALMEVPDQYQITQRLNILWKTRGINHSPVPIVPPPDGGGAPPGQQQGPYPGGPGGSGGPGPYPPGPGGPGPYPPGPSGGSAPYPGGPSGGGGPAPYPPGAGGSGPPPQAAGPGPSPYPPGPSAPGAGSTGPPFPPGPGGAGGSAPPPGYGSESATL